VKGRSVSIPVLVLFVACASLFARPRKVPAIAPEQAKAHVGQTVQVCGPVARVHLAFKTRGQPTFIDFGRPHPDQNFTAVIWGLDRGKFGDPQQLYLNKRVCVTGPIRLYRGHPEIILHSPKQVTVK
jgi:hypothetical protein